MGTIDTGTEIRSRLLQFVADDPSAASCADSGLIFSGFSIDPARGFFSEDSHGSRCDQDSRSCSRLLPTIADDVVARPVDSVGAGLRRESGRPGGQRPCRNSRASRSHRYRGRGSRSRWRDRRPRPGWAGRSGRRRPPCRDRKDYRRNRRVRWRTGQPGRAAPADARAAAARRAEARESRHRRRSRQAGRCHQDTWNAHGCNPHATSRRRLPIPTWWRRHRVQGIAAGALEGRAMPWSMRGRRRKVAVRRRGGVVAAQHRRAAEVGAESLRAGGNAVDAAIATSLALGVLEPWMSGLGGGGCMLVELADGRAPRRGCRHGGAAAACRRPPTLWPAVPPATCSAGRPWSATATCTARWRWPCRVWPTACGWRTSGSAPCRCASWWRPPWRWPRRASSSTGTRRQMVAGAALDLRRYPRRGGPMAAGRPAAGAALDRGRAAPAARRLSPRPCGAWRTRAGAASTRAGSRRACWRTAGRWASRSTPPISPAIGRAWNGRWPWTIAADDVLAMPGRSPASASPAASSCWRPASRRRRLDAAAFDAYAQRAAAGLPGAPRRATGRPRPAPRTSASSTGTATWWP